MKDAGYMTSQIYNEFAFKILNKGFTTEQLETIEDVISNACAIAYADGMRVESVRNYTRRELNREQAEREESM